MSVAILKSVPPDTLNALPFVTVAEQCRDLVALLTPTGEMIFLNVAGRQLLGTNGGADGKAQRFADLLTEPDTARFADEILPSCINRGHWDGSISFGGRVTVRPVSTHARFFTVPGNAGEPSLIVCNARSDGDGSAGIEHQARMLEVATQVASDILARDSGVQALEQFADAARSLTGAEHAVIAVGAAEGNRWEWFVTDGMPPKQSLYIQEGFCGAGIPSILLTRTTPLRLRDFAPAASDDLAPMSAFLGVPLRYDGAVIGTLFLLDKPGGFDEADEVTVFTLGAHLSVAIRNLRMYKRHRALVAGLIAAQEEERRAVAYDLHDGLTQYVVAAQMHLSVFRGAIERGEVATNKDTRSAFETGYRHLVHSVEESRRLVNKLRSLALDDIGLAGALEQLIAEDKGQAGWRETDFRHNVGDDRFPQMIETALYRIAQEALTNVRKHAAAQTVQTLLLLQTDKTKNELLLEVCDDGVGFAPGTDSADYSHIGLHGIAERVRLLQGHLEVVSEPGRGTRITVRLPLFAREEEA
ncbi:MAG: GAF domain-containing sensor histidine kinase [Fibrella sp.]|nr:GAF domain-containing sensor histidine kinase [Armatimonadota bacterium]